MSNHWIKASMQSQNDIRQYIGGIVVAEYAIIDTSADVGFLNVRIKPFNLEHSEMIPRFKDYPVELWHRRTVPPKIKSSDERLFRTKIANAAKEPPDFAGHYRFAI